MKKVYSKITNNRKKEFQIETSIHLHEGKKYVVKRALGHFSTNHLNNIFGYYERHSNSGLLCEAKKISDGVVEFEFIQGRNLLNIFLEALNHNDLNEVRGIIEKYKQLIVKLFGAGRNYEELLNIFADDVNIDLSFDNIILDNGKFLIIDYEWIKDNIEVEFVIFRTVYALVIKYGSAIAKMIKIEEFYNLFGINANRIEEFIEKNIEFNENVYGKDDSYDNYLKSYKKHQTEIDRNLYVPENYVQIYILESEDYVEKDSLKIYVTKEETDITYEIEITDKIEAVRIDPLNQVCALTKLELIGVVDSQTRSIEKFNHNAYNLGDNTYVFTSEDPQMIIDKSSLEGLSKLIIKFTVNINSEKVLQLLDCYVVNQKRIRDEEIEAEINYTKDLLNQINQLSRENQTLQHDKKMFLEMSKQLQKRLKEIAEENKVMKIKSKL